MDIEVNKFVKKSIAISGVAAIILSIVICVIWSNLPGIYEYRITSLAKSGRCERAVNALERFQLTLGDDIDSELLARCKYEIANGMYSEGRFSEAESYFYELGDYKDSVEKSKACTYGVAEQYFAEKEYQAAADCFLKLGTYSDALQRKNECLFALAEETYLQGDYSAAIEQFVELGDYANAHDRAFAIAMEITGNEGLAMELIGENVSVDSLDSIFEFSRAREELSIGRIAAGREHSVALRADGTVIATGSNEYGQCDVEEWKDIVFLSAGAYFTLGLKNDGTVVATGSNEYGQCDVNEWRDVKKIAAGDFDSLAVTNSGRLIACGYHDYSDLLELDGVADVFAGAYQAACLLDDGHIVTSHISSATTKKAVSVALSTAISVNVMPDGTISSNFTNLPQWENIVYAAANSCGVLAITADGEVKSFFFREVDSVDINHAQSKITAVSAGGRHYLLLTDDGKVLAYGDNEKSQCNVQDWQL